MEKLKKEIKDYRDCLSASEEISSSFAKDILKIARRIEYASIFPPNTLKDMQASIINFDEVQKKEQGGLDGLIFFCFHLVQSFLVAQVVLNKALVDGFQNHQIQLTNLL